MAVAVADTRGLKRICMSCGTRFYDMNKRPAVCPSCKAEYTGEAKVKGRRGRAAANEEDEPVKKTPERETEEVDRDDMVVSLEEVDEGGDEDELSMDLDDDGIGDLDDLEEDTSLEDELEAEGPDDAVKEKGEEKGGKDKAKGKGKKK